MKLDKSNISLAASMPFKNNFKEVVANKGQVNVIDGLKSFIRMREFEINELKDVDKNFLDEYAYVLLCKGIIVTAYDMQVNKINADIADYIEADYEDEDEDVVKIVRTKSFGIKPMDAEEACIQMELLGHNFFVFLNAETDEVNVVYKRKGGTFGLIEPNFD